MDIFIQELKRQLGLKRVVLYLGTSIILALLWAWFIIGGATDNFMQVSCYGGAKGSASINAAAESRKPTEGTMTIERFQKGRDVFLSCLNGSNESDITITPELLKYTVYSDLLITQEFRLREMMGESMDNLVQLPVDAATAFYENEDLYYTNYIKDNALNDGERELALSSWNKVEKPYTYYSGFKQWDEGICHLVLFSFVLMIMSAVFASSIIAKDKESGLDEIIASSKKGRTTLTLAKVSIPLILASATYILGTGLYVLILNAKLPAGSLSTTLQVAGRGILPYTLKMVLIKIWLLGIAGTISLTAFSTWISSLISKSSRVMAITVSMPLASLITGIMINSNSRALSLFSAVIPGGSVLSYLSFLSLDKFPIATVLGKSMWISTLSLISCGVVLLLSLVFTAFNYNRR